MAASNYDDVWNQLLSAGLIVSELRVGTSRPVRCRVEGDREKRGWYMLHELQTQRGDLLIVGSYGVWRGRDNGATRVELRQNELTREQMDALRKRLAEDRKRADVQRKIEAERAAQRAAAGWARCSPTGDCEYLARKGVGAHGLRFSPSGACVVPMTDTAGRIHGLQIIRTAAGAKAAKRPQKEFWPAGLAKRGHFHLLGGIPSGIVLVAEGYATAATLHEATGYPVAVAFDAGNLAPVAAALRDRYKLAKILICADDDEFSPGNPGVNAASAAALEVGGAWVRPTFADEAARREAFELRGVKLSDYNDLAATEGLHVVREQVAHRLGELGWSLTPRSRAGDNRGAGAQLRPIESLDELLDRFALVYAQSGMVFDRQEHLLLSLSDMRDICRSRELHRAWVEHPDRQIVRIEQVGFDPACTNLAIGCNLWSGWPTTPRAGRCERLLELLRYMCSKDSKPDRLYEWVLRWIAYPIQHPGAKMKSTLVIHGPQGTGKNLFFECVMAIYGRYGRVIDQSAIEDKFNDWASRKLFLIADEVVARSDLYHIKNKLKAFITGDTIRINPKNLAAYEEANHVNVVFLSNETMPVVLDEDDRRHAVIWTPEKLSHAYYAEVRAEVASGGVEALHDYLINLDLGEFSNGDLPPTTDAKEELIHLSLDSTTRFWYAVATGDIQGVRPINALSQDVYELYKVWCHRTGCRAAPMARLVNVLERKHSVRSVRKRYIDGSEIRGPHTVLLLGEQQPPEGQTETAWLGQSIAAFRAALADFRGMSC